MLNQIKMPIACEFEAFTKTFDTAFSSSHDILLRSVMDHVHCQVGKQIRPIFTLLAAKLCGEINENTLRVAAAYETLHTASLIHDDVVDNTMQRRGQPSANALFDNKVSILAGDYLLSKAIAFISDTRNPELFAKLCSLGQTLAEGELLQLQHAYSIPTEDEYISIIRRKTAILFSVTAESAAMTVQASDRQIEALRLFSDAMGICFQIKDDIFDYTTNAQIGKPTLNDIREGKITLPLLHALRQIPTTESNRILEKAKRNEFSDEYFYGIGSLVAKHHGIEYAECVIDKYINIAKDSLAVFDDSPVKNALLKLLGFTITRSK